MDFAIALGKQIYGWLDDTDTTLITVDAVRDMLARAAAEALGDRQPSRLSLRREVQPEDLTVATILELESDRLMLFDEDVATLRALLAMWQERPAQVGDPLAYATRLPDGRVVGEVVEEML